MINKKLKVGNVPNLRFPGFTEEWKVNELNALGEFLGGGTPSSSNEDFWRGSIPWVSSSDLSEGDINSVNISRFITEDAISNSATKLCSAPVILIVSRVGVGKVAYSEKSLCTSQDFLNIINFKCNGIFLSYLLSTEMKKAASAVQGTSIKGISSVEIKSKKLYVPQRNEQTKIASFLSLIDERITTQNKIIKELNVLKTTITKRIFSGQLRFKNADGDNYEDWKTKKLGDVTTLINKRNKNNEKLPVYSINNKLGFVPQSEQFEGVDSEDRGYDITLYKIIDKNTFAYNPARINVGSIGYSGYLENIIISSLYVCFKTEEFVNDNFLFQYLKTDFFNKEVLRNVEGGVRDYLFYENFARIKFDLPCVEEQRKIADYLSSIDLKVDIENQFLNKLEEQKKFLLQQMFV
ncbi:restriction endonuclease subunit S [Elizabethkingia anophelis]|uniref:restriction endonuclease subunit S n=1 Tax=Elizabethkingia anophelis TaxID=1117645 RepID=UPI0024E19F95|nr:restriction endonuclease subunit S [Elizabethkingia anophelis]CAH1149990.1 hypothetical protein EAVVTKC53_03098 [Elizabethkingia anophelis]CAI9678691.1 hypothetical protein EAVVTKC53_00745 [Elizabethkingia anophelis]